MKSDQLNTLPKITIQLQRASHVEEIDIQDLPQTLIVSDFDLTVKMPRFIPDPNNHLFLRREGAMLRGGTKALEIMQTWQKQAWGYYLVSAAPPSPIVADAIFTEMKNIYSDRQLNISQLFLNEGNVTQPQHSLKNRFGILDDFNRCIIKGNLVLNDYNKAAGTILRTMQVQKQSEKIKQIVFIDDFVMNAFQFPGELINYLHHLKDHLQDHVTITCVWLDPDNILKENPLLKKIVECGAENSNLCEYQPYQKAFSIHKPCDYTLVQYELINENLLQHKVIPKFIEDEENRHQYINKGDPR